jgi:hypothetical protein
MPEKKETPTQQETTPPVRDENGNLPFMHHFIMNDNGGQAYQAHLERARKAGINVQDTSTGREVPNPSPMKAPE